MNEIDNYKYMFFKELYDSLDLKAVEQKLLDEKIKSLDVVSDKKIDIISNYFFLLNDANIEFLNTEQLQNFHFYFSKDVNTLTDEEKKKVKEFIDETYSLILFPKVNNQYVYYGPISDDYICPRDAIAIGLYYDALGGCDNFEVENKLSNIINHIQFNLAKKINKKIAVIPFNQITLENEFSGFSK